jgi:hypothetical protein
MCGDGQNSSHARCDNVASLEADHRVPWHPIVRRACAVRAGVADSDAARRCCPVAGARGHLERLVRLHPGARTGARTGLGRHRAPAARRRCARDRVHRDASSSRCRSTLAPLPSGRRAQLVAAVSPVCLCGADVAGDVPRDPQRRIAAVRRHCLGGVAWRATRRRKACRTGRRCRGRDSGQPGGTGRAGCDIRASRSSEPRRRVVLRACRHLAQAPPGIAAAAGGRRLEPAPRRRRAVAARSDHPRARRNHVHRRGRRAAACARMQRDRVRPVLSPDRRRRSHAGDDRDVPDAGIRHAVGAPVSRRDDHAGDDCRRGVDRRGNRCGVAAAASAPTGGPRNRDDAPGDR